MTCLSCHPGHPVGAIQLKNRRFKLQTVIYLPKVKKSVILLIEEILHHLGWLKPYKKWAGFCPSAVLNKTT